MELSNREVSVILWFFVFVIWAVTKTKASKYVHNIIKIIFSKRVFSVILITLAYVSLIIWLLYKGGLWDISQTKNSVIWTFSVALLTMFRVNDILKEDKYFRKAALDNIKIVAAIEFIIHFHTLNIFIELLLVPVTTFLVMLQAYTEVYDSEDNEIVHSIATRTLGVVVICLLSYEIAQIYINPDLFLTKSTLLDFGMPIILSIMFLPFLYFLAVYMLYSDIFLRLGILTNNEDGIRYAKVLTITTFTINVTLLKRWAKNIHKINYHNRDEIKSVVNAIKNGTI